MSVVEIKQIGSSDVSLTCEITDAGQGVVRKLWFQTSPITGAFLRGLSQLQLITSAQAFGTGLNNPFKGIGTWFELVIERDGEECKELVHKSHSISPDLEEDCLQFGIVFHNQSELLKQLKANDVISVYACSGGEDSGINTVQATLMAALWTPGWSIISHIPMLQEADLGFGGKQRNYTITPPDGLKVEVVATSSEVAAVVWYSTPAITADVLSGIDSFQLFTHARNQQWANDETKGMWTWFEIVILDTPNDIQPKKREDGRDLAWRSHKSTVHQHDNNLIAGTQFGRKHELFSFLEEGDAIGVRVCAQFPMWSLSAHHAHLEARVHL